jgi:hypothetical protein
MTMRPRLSSRVGVDVFPMGTSTICVAMLAQLGLFDQVLFRCSQWSMVGGAK